VYVIILGLQKGMNRKHILKEGDALWFDKCP